MRPGRTALATLAVMTVAAMGARGTATWHCGRGAQTEWRTHDPSVTFTNGLTEDFDLVADGGTDNVWIGEVGDVDTSTSFDDFVDVVSSAIIEVEHLGSTEVGVSRGFDVTYDSPSEGRLEFSWTGPLTVDGVEQELHGTDRFANPFGTTALGDTTVEISDGTAALTLDLIDGERRATLSGE